jgi:hypothetical protein
MLPKRTAAPEAAL